MKKIQFILFAFVFAAFMSCNTSGAGNDGSYAPELKTKLDTISYLYGYSNGKGWKQQGIDDMDMSIFMGGMNEAFSGEEPKVDMVEGGNIVRGYIREIREKKAEINLEKGNEFLAKNGKKKGILTTPSGLQYEIIEQGGGPKPTITDRVEVHYHGTTLDGEVFDSSIERDKPAQFFVNQVVKGWTEALQLMPEGSKYKLYIPASLGYGERGTPSIGPNEVLVFDLELLEILETPQSNQAPKK